MKATCYRGIRVLLLSLALLAPSSTSFAFFVRPMKAEEVEKLSVPARQQYDQAMQLFDQIQYDKGLQVLFQAAELDKTHAEIQMYTARLLQTRARMKTGEESKALFAQATILINNYLQKLDLSESDRELARKRLQECETEIAAIPEREERRLQIGERIQLQLADEMAKPQVIEGEIQLSAGQQNFSRTNNRNNRGGNNQNNNNRNNNDRNNNR